MPQLNVRMATPDDIAIIHTFIYELAEFEKLAHQVTGTADQLRDCLFGTKKFAEVIVAELLGLAPASEPVEAIGFALFFHSFSTFKAKPGIYLEDLYVRPQHRGHGAGLALLRELAQIAAQRGCVRVDWSVLDWNTAAQDFYLRIGAKHIKEWQTFRLDAAAIASLA